MCGEQTVACGGETVACGGRRWRAVGRRWPDAAESSLDMIRPAPASLPETRTHAEAPDTCRGLPLPLCWNLKDKE